MMSTNSLSAGRVAGAVESGVLAAISVAAAMVGDGSWTGLLNTDLSPTARTVNNSSPTIIPRAILP
jgi:hypothetical protein